MFEKLNSPQELFQYKLGAALKMENTVLGMLGDLEEAAQKDDLKQQFRHHADETREQIRNIEQAFSVLGEEPDDSLVDAVILSGAAETEHHEIAVYEGLITEAEAMGKQDIVQLLSQNLEQEQHTLEEVKHATHELAQEQFAQAR